MQWKRFRRRPRRWAKRRAGGGYSLLEILFAFLILMIICLAIMPLFFRSTKNLASGRDSSRISGFSREQAEAMMPVEFNGPELTVPAGTTELASRQVWIPAPQPLLAGNWSAGESPISQWGRNVTVRQYGLFDLNDDRMFDTPLAGDADPGGVQIKEVVIEVAGSGANAQSRRSLRLRYLKAF